MIETLNNRARNVLVIEDDLINREILSAILSDHYNVIQAENGKIGLDILNEGGYKISLILLDIQMPVMNGYEFLEEVGKVPTYKNIPIIVTTSSNTAEDEIKCLEIGASDFVSKPYNTDVVLRRVGSMIRLSEASSVINKVERDALTGFYSREFFFTNVENMMIEDPLGNYDIICFEVSSFKMMQKRFGTEKSSEHLKVLTKAIKEFCPKGSILGRYNQSVFFAFFAHSENVDYEYISENVRMALADLDVLHDVIHIGINPSVNTDLPIAELCDNAMATIEKVTYQYGKQYAEYNLEFESQLLRQRAILGSMEAALKNGKFDVFYQPKHSLESGKTGGAEALVRWTHPTLGFISPGEFIPLFESSEFITELDYYIADKVCSDIRSWIDRGLPAVPVSWNLSRIDFSDPKLAETIQSTVNKYGIPQELVHLEVTESAYTKNTTSFLGIVNTLHDMGYKIELDDFGAGYSSLTALAEMNVDILKLDMRFAKTMDSQRQEIILNNVFQIARNLGMDVVAEGVETIDQVEKYRSMGCKYIQGYYYSKPIPKDQFEEYLKNQEV